MKELYTLNLDTNNYVLSIAHTKNDNVEVDLSQADLRYLNAYQFINGKMVLDDKKKQDIIEAEKTRRKTPTTEKRIDALEATTDDMVLLMAELIGG